jgi:hypothetical protein
LTDWKFGTLGASPTFDAVDERLPDFLASRGVTMTTTLLAASRDFRLFDRRHAFRGEADQTGVLRRTFHSVGGQAQRVSERRASGET